MSKISAKNLREAAIRSSRQSAAWVIGLRNRYRRDPFFRTEWNVILLHAFFAVSMLFFFTLAFDYLYRGVTRILVNGLIGIEGTTGMSGTAILDAAQSVKTRNFILVLFLSLLVTAAFGYFIARVTLSPVRNALSLQKRFISDIAHELRTPIAVIKTNSEVMLLDDNLAPEVSKTFKSNIEELDRTSEIINNLLSFSNWTSPDRVSFGNVDLGSVITAAVRKLQVLAQGKEIKVTVHKKKPYIVWGNATALEQIAVNLLKNAINYTPSKGHVSISAEPDYQGHVLMTIEDTGIGISSQDLHHIFEPFYRAEQSRTRTSGSSGLGLTIVSELIKLHKGKIIIQSTPNRGTTAIVVIPSTNRRTPTQPLFGSEKQSRENEVSLDFQGRRS